MELEGRCALITGASRGIGEGIAFRLAENGADIAVNYVELGDGRNHTDALRVVSRIEGLGRHAIAVEGDVADFASVERMVTDVLESFGHIDILVNNAAVLRDKTLKKMSIEDWHTVIDINLSGVFNCCRASINHMLDRERGSIVNISSISGQTGFFGQTNYSAAKAGVMGLTKSLARETASKGITVNCIAPGMVETEMAREIPEEVRRKFLDMIPMGRFANPVEIADLASFLVSDRARYITGQTININGGWFM